MKNIIKKSSCSSGNKSSIALIKIPNLRIKVDKCKLLMRKNLAFFITESGYTQEKMAVIFENFIYDDRAWRKLINGNCGISLEILVAFRLQYDFDLLETYHSDATIVKIRNLRNEPIRKINGNLDHMNKIINIRHLMHCNYCDFLINTRTLSQDNMVEIFKPIITDKHHASRLKNNNRDISMGLYIALLKFYNYDLLKE